MLLGIDVGTQGTRALVLDAHGKITAQASAAHEAFASPRIGWAEQSPDDWWRAARKAIRQALNSADLRAEQIRAVGFSGQMHGAVTLDEKDEPVRPALIWCDQRTERQARELTARVGAERLIALTSNPALPNMTLTKLLWLREQEPENWRRVRSVMLPKDYVRLRLTGERATDVADASGTLLLDVARRKWSDELLSLVEIDRALLPSLHESPAVCAQVSRAGAEATGLRMGTPVVAGAGDQAAGAVGSGIVAPGTVSATIGTSGVVFAATDRPARDPHGRLHSFCHALPDRWHVMGVTQAAGLSLRWLRDTFHTEDYDALVAEAAKVPAGAEGLYWTPYLMGERTPHLDSRARAALVGLTAQHTRGHVTRAILEGVAFSLRDTLSILEEMQVPVSAIRLAGGGARSALWRQVQADVYGREVARLEAEEGAAFGAAILAGVGAGIWPSVESATEALVRVAETQRPDPSASRLLDRQYRFYRRIYQATRFLNQESEDGNVSTATRA